MLAPRWRKILSDLWSNKTRTFLTALTIAIGVFAVGSVSGTFIMMLQDMDVAFQSVNPGLGQLLVSSFKDDLLESVRRVPGVKEAEGRSAISGQVITTSGTKHPIQIQGGEFTTRQIDKIFPTDGTTSLALNKGEILIEHGARLPLGLKVGDMITIDIPDLPQRQLKIAGFVLDINNQPYSFGQTVLGYVTTDTMAWIGGPDSYSQLNFTTTELPHDEAHVTEIGKAISKKIEDGGYTVYYTYTSRPGQHWASQITSSLAVIMIFLGVLAVLLSTFLVFNTLNAQLQQQVRHIGIFKAVGARTPQVMAMYLFLVLCYGVIALVFTVPLSTWVSYIFAGGMGRYLNFELQGFRLVPEAFYLQLAVGLLVPVVAALLPVWNGARITIREAISSYGLGKGRFGRSWFDHLLEKINFLSRPLMISLRNTFRRKARLLLTLSTLTLGGAIFIGVLNVKASFDYVMPKTFGYFLSDANIAFSLTYRAQRLKPIAMSVPGVVDAEGWGGAMGQIFSPDKKTQVQVILFAPPAGSKLIQADLTGGRWLQADDENAIVIGNHLLAKRPDLKVGDSIVMKIGERESTWRIVGTYQMVGNVEPPFVYVNYDYLARLMNTVDQVSELRIVTNQHDLATQQRVIKDLEAAFKAEGIRVNSSQAGAVILQQQNATINIFIYLLLFMAVLIALVGGIGLMGTMSINVMERTREIGVMRAIGASNGSIFQLVVVEGMLIGGISAVLGELLAMPITSFMDYAIGAGIVQAPLPVVYSFNALLLWLAIVVIIAALASFLPARNAVRLTIREVLAYE